MSAIECAPVAEDLGVELGVGHDLERRVEARRLVVAHEDCRRAPMLRDRDSLVAACDIVDESTELRLRLGQRQRLHDLTSLQTNCGIRPGAGCAKWEEAPGGRAPTRFWDLAICLTLRYTVLHDDTVLIAHG